MALPDSGNPADFSPEQIQELLATPKESLTKNQRAALARHNFQKAKAEQAAAGGAPAPQPTPSPATGAATVSAPAAPPATGSAAAPPPPKAAAKAAAAPKAPGFQPTPDQLAKQREAAQAFPYAAELRARLGDAVEDVVMARDKPCLVLKPGAVDRALAEAHAAGFRHLAVLTAVDYPPDRIETVYTLLDMDGHRWLAAKARLPRAAPTVRSVSAIWPGAVWLEREVWDMFGVRFDGLADHRRMLLPDGWTGHPLLKDYDQTKEQYIALTEEGDDLVTFEEAKGW